MEAMQLAWDFFQNQILGMKWLNTLTGRLLSSLGVDITGRWGGAGRCSFLSMTPSRFLCCSRC